MYFCTSLHHRKRTQDKLVSPPCIVKNDLDFCHYLPSSLLKLKYRAIFQKMLQNDRRLCRQQQVLEIPCYICGLQAWGETFAFLNLCWRQGMGAQGATVLMDFLFSAWVGISVRWHGKQMSGAVGRRVWGAGLWVYLATDSFPVNLWPFTHVFCRGGGEIKSYKTKFCAYSSVNTEKKCFCMQKALKVPSSSNCSVQLFFFFNFRKFSFW